MQFYEINICQIMIFKIYAVNKKHEVLKIGSQIREKLQVLSQMLEYNFVADCTFVCY